MPKLNINFTDVSEGGSKIPEGDYLCKITKVTKEEGDKAPYLKWILTIGTGEYKGKTLSEITTLAPKGLFNLYNFLSAAAPNIPIPKSAFQLDTDKYIGKIIGGTVAEEEYVDKKTGKSKTASHIVDVWPAKKDANGRFIMPKATKITTKPPVVEEEETEEPEVSVETDEVEEIEI